MKRPVIFRRLADEEFHSAVEWYDEARDGLGSEFSDAVQLILEEISIAPKRFPVIDSGVRLAAVNGFPFGVYYRIRPDQIVVIAVYHQSRDPQGWQRRL